MTKTVIGAAAIAMLALTGVGNAIAEDASTEIMRAHEKPVFVVTH